jgi:hypothetical protein
MDRYVPFFMAAMAGLYVAYVAGLELAARKSVLLKPLGSWIVMGLFIAVLWFAIFRLYFYVDGLAAKGAGATSDDAMIAPIEALKMGRALYDLEGLLGPPASPGPGWLLLNAPFTYFGHAWPYTLLTPAYTALGWLMLRWAGQSVLFANLWLLMMFSGLISWELAVGGYDIIALSVSVMALYLLVERYALGPVTSAGLWIAVAVGVFGTARIVFPYLAPLFGLLIWKFDRRNAVVFTLVALAVTAGVHAAFWFGNQPYEPFHLLQRGETRMGPGMMIAGALATAACCGLALWRMKPTRESALGWFTLCLTTPFVFIALGELIDLDFAFFRWEGGNYLLPAVATACLFVLRKTGLDAARQA